MSSLKQAGKVALSAATFGLFGKPRDAARSDTSETRGWEPGLRFAGGSGLSFDAEWTKILARSRDLDENNGWIRGGLDRRVESVIGVNIRLRAQPSHLLLRRNYDWRMTWTADVEERFKVWCNDVERRCDTRKRFSFGANARLAYLQYVRDGEAAAEIRDLKRGIPNPTSILLVEPERISTPDNNTRLEGPRFRNGIEYDVNGAPVRYHVRNNHPLDPAEKVATWTTVNARTSTGRAKFIHVFNPRRAEQNRGISRLAEAMLPAKMLDRVDRAEVESALKQALLSIFIKSAGTTDDLEAALAPTGSESEGWFEEYVDHREKSPVKVEGGSVTHLYPGEDVEIPERSSPNGNYPDFAKYSLQKLSAAIGVSYPQMSQNWADINYSSARALLNELWRSFKEDRLFFTQAFLTPIYAAWLEWEVANGDVKIPGGPSNFYRQKTAITMAEWIGPGRGSVDPLKESNAANLDTAAGRTSTVEHILEAGRDPNDIVAEEVWFQKTREDAGLPPVNHNVKTEGGGGEDDTTGTEADRDGDGIPNENKRKRDNDKEEGR